MKDVKTSLEKKPYSLKGEFYFLWGWNRSYYSDADITFKGDDYNFTLYEVDAYDRQSPFSIDLYFNPSTITIPQYNFKLGYYFTDTFSLNIGFDHMKYVMESGQTTKINGNISNSGTAYDGNYSDEDIVVAPDFLLFEHTDGLNYLNLEASLLTNILQIDTGFMGDFDINLLNGASIGLMVLKVMLLF